VQFHRTAVHGWSQLQRFIIFPEPVPTNVDFPMRQVPSRRNGFPTLHFRAGKQCPSKDTQYGSLCAALDRFSCTQWLRSIAIVLARADSDADGRLYGWILALYSLRSRSSKALRAASGVEVGLRGGYRPAGISGLRLCAEPRGCVPPADREHRARLTQTGEKGAARSKGPGRKTPHVVAFGYLPRPRTSTSLWDAPVKGGPFI